jgi:allantoin racemase
MGPEPVSPSTPPLRILDLVPVVYTKGLRHAFADREKLAQQVARRTGNRVRLEIDSLDRGSPSIEDAYDEAVNTPYILAKTKAAEAEGFSAAIIDCFGDPGLDAARELVRMPVLGVAQSAMHLTAQLAPRFSVINTVPEFEHIDHELVVKYGLSQQLASVITIDIPVLSLEAQESRTIQALLRAVETAVRAHGAQAIVLGCTGMSSLVDAAQKQLTAKGLGVPIVEPLRAAVYTAFAYLFGGLTHSKEAFRPPRAKRRLLDVPLLA